METKATGGGAGAAAAPTGCFKCGRPGHWSRDCPSSSSSGNRNPSPNLKTIPPSSRFSQQLPPAKPSAAATTTTRKAPRTRPKLTPDILLSNDGLGYVLRHFPRAFKYHGRGHEVADLGNLIGLYAQWHSHLIPYYSFEQFVHKVEQVGASKRVRRCISELKDRVARGGDPTKLHEAPVEQVATETEQDYPILGDPVADAVDPSLESHEADHIREEMFDEIYHNATELQEPSQFLQQEPHHVSEIQGAADVNSEHGSTEGSASQTQVAASCVPAPSKIQITEEQRARMDANRLKALERAAARARSQPS